MKWLLYLQNRKSVNAFHHLPSTKHSREQLLLTRTRDLHPSVDHAFLPSVHSSIFQLWPEREEKNKRERATFCNGLEEDSLIFESDYTCPVREIEKERYPRPRLGTMHITSEVKEAATAWGASLKCLVSAVDIDK